MFIQMLDKCEPSEHIFNLSGKAKTKKSLKNKNKHTPCASYYQVTQFLFQVQTSLLLESLKGTRKLQASELLHTHTHTHLATPIDVKP